MARGRRRRRRRQVMLWRRIIARTVPPGSRRRAAPDLAEQARRTRRAAAGCARARARARCVRARRAAARRFMRPSSISARECFARSTICVRGLGALRPAADDVLRQIGEQQLVAACACGRAPGTSRFAARARCRAMDSARSAPSASGDDAQRRDAGCRLLAIEARDQVRGELRISSVRSRSGGISIRTIARRWYRSAPNSPRRDELAEIAVGRGDDAEVDLAPRVLAEPADRRGPRARAGA